MSCSITGHDHGHDAEPLGTVYRCNLCGTEFEGGVADDDGSTGLARCPQCFMSDIRPIERTEFQDFIIRKSTKFR